MDSIGTASGTLYSSSWIRHVAFYAAFWTPIVPNLADVILKMGVCGILGHETIPHVIIPSPQIAWVAKYLKTTQNYRALVGYRNQYMKISPLSAMIHRIFENF